MLPRILRSLARPFLDVLVLPYVLAAFALAQVEPFMKSVIANLDNDWTLSSADIDKALA